MWPHRQQLTRLPRPWDFPGKNTGVGCHFLLQCMKVKSESEVTQSCPTLSDPMDCSLPGSSIHGVFQARVLEWGAITFSIAVWYKRNTELVVRVLGLGASSLCQLTGHTTWSRSLTWYHLGMTAVYPAPRWTLLIQLWMWQDLQLNVTTLVYFLGDSCVSHLFC